MKSQIYPSPFVRDGCSNYPRNAKWHYSYKPLQIFSLETRLPCSDQWPDPFLWNSASRFSYSSSVFAKFDFGRKSSTRNVRIAWIRWGSNSLQLIINEKGWKVLMHYRLICRQKQLTYFSTFNSLFFLFLFAPGFVVLTRFLRCAFFLLTPVIIHSKHV